MIRAEPLFLLALVLAAPMAPSQSAPTSAAMPEFDAATVRSSDANSPNLRVGFSGQAGGRIHFGGSIRMLVQTAFSLNDYQIAGGPAWSRSQWFEINAVPPESSPSRSIKVETANPSADQRLMLQSLLRDRFRFKWHMETKEGEVYILMRGKRALQLKPPKDPAADPRAAVWMKPGSIVDGEAAGTNTTMDYLAWRLARYLMLPVENQTGIEGSYDFDLPAVDPDNEDMVSAVFGVVDRLGLKLKRARGPLETLVIDHVEQPSAN